MTPAGAGRIAGSVLEAHQVARRFACRRLRQKAGLAPAELRRAIGQAGQLPDGVERDLRIVRARLNRDVPARLRGVELIAVEFRQVDERRRPPGREAVTVPPSLTNSPAPKPKVMVSRPGDRPSADPPSGPSTDRSCPRSRAVSPADMRAAASVQPRSIVDQLVAAFGQAIKRREIAVRLLGRGDPALMRAKERLAERGFAWRDWRRGARRVAAPALARAPPAPTKRPRRVGPPPSRERAAHFAKTSVLFSSSTK